MKSMESDKSIPWDNRHHRNPLVADLTTDLRTIIDRHATRYAGSDVCGDQADPIVIGAALSAAWDEAISRWLHDVDMQAKARQANASLGGTVAGPTDATQWKPVREVIAEIEQYRKENQRITAKLSVDGVDVSITGERSDVADAVACLIDS